jgi:hypothetical protein
MQRASSAADDDYIPDTSNQKLGFLAKQQNIASNNPNLRVGQPQI